MTHIKSKTNVQIKHKQHMMHTNETKHYKTVIAKLFSKNSTAYD